MSVNPESVAHQGGEFHNRVPPSEPLTTKGHAPGTKVGNDAYPEFHAQTFPAGTAPTENTFQPNPKSEVPGQAQNNAATAHTSASDTLIGSTSADVHTGLGHPGSGQTSQEMHDGSKQRGGLEGVGASLSDPVREQRNDVSVAPDSRGKTQNPTDYPGAENRVPESAETVAAERSYRGQ